MSEEAKRRTLERLEKDIDQKEKILVGLKADILSRQKLLDTLNNEKGGNTSLAQAMKRHEDEILVRDKQIATLYQRIEELQKTGTPKDSTVKQQPPQANVEELTQAWEAQKVKYVEEIQNLTIELKKYNKQHEDKVKALEETIKSLRVSVTEHEEKENKYIDEIEQLKSTIEKLEKDLDDEKKHFKERVEALDKENNALGNIREHLQGTLNDKEDSLKRMESQILDSEKSQRDKHETIDELNKEIAALKAENAKLTKSRDDLSVALGEKEQSLVHMQLNLETFADEKAALREQLDTEKKEGQDIQAELKGERKKVADVTQTLEQQKDLIKSANLTLEQTKVEKDELVAKIRRLEDSHAEKTNADRKNSDAKVKEQEELIMEIERLQKEKASQNSSYEDKLQLIKEENDREMAKLSALLESSEAERKEKIHVLEEKQQRLKDLEAMNKTFEGLVQGLKTTILEVQERLDKNGRYITDLQKRLEAKEAELALARPQNVVDKENEINRLKQVIEGKDADLAKMEKNLIQMIDEANMFKQKYKNASEKLIVINKGQTRTYTKQISDKDTEIDILKEMLKSSQGVIRTKELEIQRLKHKYKEDTNTNSGSPLKLPSLSGDPLYRKESNKQVFTKMGAKMSSPEADMHQILNEFKEKERESIAKKEREKQNVDIQVSAIEDMTNHLQEIVKIKQMTENYDTPYDKPTALPGISTKFGRVLDKEDDQTPLDVTGNTNTTKDKMAKSPVKPPVLQTGLGPDPSNPISPARVSKRKVTKKTENSDDEKEDFEEN